MGLDVVVKDTKLWNGKAQNLSKCERKEEREALFNRCICRYRSKCHLNSTSKTYISYYI